MIKQNFNQSVGFPFQTETLDEMQKAYSIFNALGNLAGNFTIISGCVVIGSIVGDGVVFINGEVFEFRGGTIAADVIIVENITAQEFEDGNERDVLFERYATFGAGLNSIPWANFKRPKTLQFLTQEIIAINDALPLKAETSVIQSLIDRIALLEARPAYVNEVINEGYVTIGDILTVPVGATLIVGGDCFSAVVLPYVDPSNLYVEVTMNNAMPNLNYVVKMFNESLGNLFADNDAGWPSFKIVSTTKFRFGLYEASASVQSIKIHFEAKKL